MLRPRPVRRRRRTDLPAETPLALSEEFADDRTKQTQWAAFVRKGSLDAGGLLIVLQRGPMRDCRKLFRRRIVSDSGAGRGV